MKLQNFKIPNPDEGRVIQIISDDKLIVNLGKNELNVFDKIEIYKNLGDKIMDPLTGDDLGYYRFVKDTLVIIQVEDKFSIAEAPMGRRYKESSLSAFYDSIISKPEYEVIPGKLNVDEKDIKYLALEADEKIHVGDLVRKVEVKPNK